MMCPCRRGMCSTPACFTVCGVTVRFDGRAASGAGTVGAGSARWSASTSGRPRPTPGRWPATLPWPKIPKQPAKNLERSPYWLPRNRIVAWATLRLAQRACRRSTRPDASVAEMQCKSGRPALGSSRPRLRAPASGGHPSQSSTGRDIDVRYGVSWRIPQLVGECVAKFGITWRVAAQSRAVQSAESARGEVSLRGSAHVYPPQVVVVTLRPIRSTVVRYKAHTNCDVGRCVVLG